MGSGVATHDDHFVGGGTSVCAHHVAVAAQQGHAEARVVGGYRHRGLEDVAEVVDPAGAESAQPVGSGCDRVATGHDVWTSSLLRAARSAARSEEYTSELQSH